MKKYLLIYKDDYPSYDVQIVEDYWELSYQQEPVIIIELTDDMINDIKKLESKGEWVCQDIM